MTNEQIAILADIETGITSDLCDSETGDVIREATGSEARESVAAGHEGHIDPHQPVGAVDVPCS